VEGLGEAVLDELQVVEDLEDEGADTQKDVAGELGGLL